MKVYRAYKVELDPNNKQKTVLLRHAGAARFAWNWALARRIEEYKATGKTLSAYSLGNELVALKKTSFTWMKELSSHAVGVPLIHLDKAFSAFFRRLKQGKKPGFPKFKSRKQGIGSFTMRGLKFGHTKKDYINLPRIGWLHLKEHGYIPTNGIKILSTTVSQRAGRWFVSVQCEQYIKKVVATGEPVSVDLGIKTLAVVSDKRKFKNPKALRQRSGKLARLQRKLSKQKKGGSNREKTKRLISRLHYRISCVRLDAIHKATSAICAKTKPVSERPSVIVIEDLGIKGMMKNHCLAGAISDASMAEFRRQLEYKAKWYGSRVLVADRFFPSSKLCSKCGRKNKKLELKDRRWACKHCHKTHDRDLNAARNLRQLAPVA